MRYARWLRHSLRALDDLPPELSEPEFDGFGSTVREAGRRAALAGVSEAVKLCAIRDGGLSPATAREVLAACLALAEPPTEGMLTLQQAAAALGLSVSGLRKLVRRGSIRFAQRTKHAVIRFRREWLDDYANAKAAPAKPVRKLTPSRRKLAVAHGFNPSFLG